MKSIIVEGFDNCGKSTLISKLSSFTGSTVFVTGSRAKSQLDEIIIINKQIQAIKEGQILDRFTPISAACYNIGNSKHQQWLYDTVLKWSIDQSIIIWCNVPNHVCTDFSTHQLNSNESANTNIWLENNSSRILHNYKKLFEIIPHVPFDWTSQNSDEFLERFFEYYFAKNDNF